MTKLEQALHILSEYISETRRFRLHTAALKRSTHVSLLLENITDFGNQNAALRTMEGLGFHNVHRIFVNELKKNRRATRTDAGAKQWLNVREWGSTRSCVQYLRSAGYVIASAQLEATHTLEDIKLDQKLVVAFGNERDGISHELEELSDYTFSLPMWGLVQSYNVSVAVAMTLFHCRTMFTDHVTSQQEFQCNTDRDKEYQRLMLQFYTASMGIKQAKLLLASQDIFLADLIDK